MGDALREESVIKDDVIHSNRALSESMITIAGNADGSTHANLGKLGRLNESSIEPLRSLSSQFLLILVVLVIIRDLRDPHKGESFWHFFLRQPCKFVYKFVNYTFVTLYISLRIT